MKKVIFSWLLSAMFISTAMAQFGATRTGFEGDNFSLEGALELFKDSRSVQDFERRLNTKTNWVNNLDLDYNGRTDYIRVNHRRQGNLNAIILQVPVDRRYVQDIAVIQIEQTGRRRAILQMVGDADLYGSNVVVEPYDDFNSDVNVYRWRAVRNILDGYGNTYASPYAFNNYPVWYSPWDQYAWSAYQPRFSSYGRYYRVSPYNRLSNVYGIYSPYRAYCPVVRTRTARIRSQQPGVNRTTTTRATTRRPAQTTAQTSSRATSRATTQTRSTTNRTRATSLPRATTQTRTTNSRTSATSQPRATTSTRRASTPVTRSTNRPTVRRDTPSRTSSASRTSRPATTRATAAPRTSRASTPRATTQPRRTATPSRAATPRRSAAPVKPTVTKRPAVQRSGSTRKQ